MTENPDSHDGVMTAAPSRGAVSHQCDPDDLDRPLYLSLEMQLYGSAIALLHPTPDGQWAKNRDCLYAT